MAKKKPYRYPLYLLARTAAGIICLMPRRWTLALARAGGRLAYRLVERQRRMTVENLKRAYGAEKSAAEIERIARGVFENMAQTAAEIVMFEKLSKTDFMKHIDAEEAFAVYRALHKEGKGIISITAHMGNWELISAAACMTEFDGGVIARKIYYEPYDRWLVGLRRAMNVKTIYREEAARRALQVLKKNLIVGILPDQDIDSMRGLFIDFFGKPAYTPIAPVRLAISSGAPIAVNFMIRMPGDRYKLVAGEVIRVPEGVSRDEAVRQMTENWMRQFEAMIRRYPEQWGWMHNRWQTRPEDVAAAEKKETVKIS